MDETRDRSSLTPIQIHENPELAALRILKTTLDVVDRALVGAYPESGEPSYPDHDRSEPDAYALAILHQIDALGALLDLYVESIRRLGDRRDREACDQDIPF